MLRCTYSSWNINIWFSIFSHSKGLRGFSVLYYLHFHIFHSFLGKSTRHIIHSKAFRSCKKQQLLSWVSTLFFIHTLHKLQIHTVQMLQFASPSTQHTCACFDKQIETRFSQVSKNLQVTLPISSSKVMMISLDTLVGLVFLLLMCWRT